MSRFVVVSFLKMIKFLVLLHYVLIRRVIRGIYTFWKLIVEKGVIIKRFVSIHGKKMKKFAKMEGRFLALKFGFLRIKKLMF